MLAQPNMNRSNRLRAPLLLATVCALLLATACGSKQPKETEASETPQPPVIETIVPSETPEPEPPAILAPLTGLPVDREITNRPFSVMINNLKPARPQSGMTQADVVWEMLAEGGVTRFVAVFQSKEFTDPIGPVRSIRPYYIEVGELYEGVLVHAGASNEGFGILRKERKHHLDEITNAGSFFWRDKSRKAPHNVYTDLEKLRAGAERLKYPLTADMPVVPFTETPNLIGAEPAAEVNIKFQLSSYKVNYTYDETKGTYARFINGEPHIDKNNDEQLTAANLVVFSTRHHAYDKEGRLEVDLKSGGDAVLIQQGKAIAANWVRDGNFIRIMKDGKELPFVPGTTYYHVVPNSSPLSQHVEYQ